MGLIWLAVKLAIDRSMDCHWLAMRHSPCSCFAPLHLQLNLAEVLVLRRFPNVFFDFFDSGDCPLASHWIAISWPLAGHMTLIVFLCCSLEFAIEFDRSAGFT